MDERTPSISASMPERISVLLVEDDPVYAALVQMVLEDCAKPVFDVCHVNTLGDALVQCRISSVDVVLLDLSLPDMSGIDTVRSMRTVAPDLPLVVMTGLDDHSFAVQALEEGVQDYLVKSDEPHRTVMRSIQNAITRMNAQREREALLRRVEILLDEVATERARLQAELDHARTMQLAMLPTPARIHDDLERVGLAVESYFEPCSAIGGDLWGLFPASNGRLGIYSFDFAGHGVGAALNVFRLHTLLEEHAVAAEDPAVVLALLNDLLKGMLQRGQYATMFLAMIDTAAERMVWAGAGAPPPLLVTGGKATALDTRGIPLGLRAKASYQSHSVAFPRGSGLFVYSDAMTEAKWSESDDMVDLDGLRNLVMATLVSSVGGGLDALIDRFVESVETPLKDDLTAVWCYWLPAGGPG